MEEAKQKQARHRPAGKIEELGLDGCAGPRGCSGSCRNCAWFYPAAAAEANEASHPYNWVEKLLDDDRERARDLADHNEVANTFQSCKVLRREAHLFGAGKGIVFAKQLMRLCSCEDVRDSEDECDVSELNDVDDRHLRHLAGGFRVRLE